MVRHVGAYLAFMCHLVTPEVTAAFTKEYDDLWTEVVAEPPPWDPGM